MRLFFCAFAVLAGVVVTSRASAATLTVGPSGTYPKPCAAIAAAHDGDTITIDAAGSYDGDVCAWSTNGLTIQGINGRPHIDAAGANSQGKAIWVIGGSDTTIENVEMSGCQVSDENGAAIRQEGNNLTLRRVFFHDNQDGILTDPGASSEILIEYSEFADNGAGDGYSHNMYIGVVGKFTLRYSWSHHSKVGHLVKSRALENHILYNLLSDDTDGTGSYELDLPQGGTSFVIGNVIQQSTATQNPNVFAFGEEAPGAPLNPKSDLFVVNNTFVNDGPSGAFVLVGAAVTTPAVLRNNVFFGPGSPSSQATAVLDHDYSGDPMFVDPASQNYRVMSGSPVIDAGASPGMGDGVDLTPTHAYVQPANADARTVVGTIDIGAYEFGGEGGGGAGGDATTGTTSGGDGSTTGSGSGHGSTSGQGSTGSGSGHGASGSGSGNQGSGGASGAGGGSSTGGSGDSGGCSCSIEGRASSSGAGALGLLALALLRRRKKTVRS